MKVAVRYVDVDSQYLSEQHVWVLCVVERIVTVSAVSRGVLQESVRPEGQMPAIVIREVRMLDERETRRPHEWKPGKRVGDKRVTGGTLDPGDEDVPVGPARVVHVKAPRRGVVRRKGQPEQQVPRSPPRETNAVRSRNGVA